MLINQNVWQVFQTMVVADVLVIDASMFPITAAVLNKNLIIANAIEKSRCKFPYGGYEKRVLSHWKII